MNSYEAIVITKPEQNKTYLIDTIKEIIKAGGVFEYMEDWGCRKLAYPIHAKHGKSTYDSGNYSLINFHCKKSEKEKIIEELNKLLTEEEICIKHIIVLKSA